MGAGHPPDADSLPSDMTLTGARRLPIRLRVQLGTDMGRVYTMSGDTLTMGRAQDNDLVLDDPQASRYHARLVRKENATVVEDLGSTNGTLVNGRRITEPHALQPTETIAIGGTVFSVEGLSAPTTVGMPPVRPDPSRRPRTVTAPLIEAKADRKGGVPWPVVIGLGGLIIVVALILVLGGLLSQLVSRQGAQLPSSIPSVFIQSPVTGSQVQVGETVTVKTVASDSSGILRAELWVGGSMVDQEESEVAGGQPSFPVDLYWTPTVAGGYTLEVRAYNSQNVASAPTTVMVTVVNDGAIPAPSPTATGFPGTATAAGPPVAVTTVDLNVREGPGQDYPIIDLLSVGTEVQISGKSPDGTWWRIIYPLEGGGHGWVYAPFTRSSNAEDVPVVETPVPPTETSTPTVTPTNTVTPSPSLTATPAPVVTLTPIPTPTSAQAVVVEVIVTKDAIDPGECTTLQWHIENVRAAFLSGGEFDNLGLTGPFGSRDVCPGGTTLYILRAETDGGVIEETVTVMVRPVQEVTLGAIGGQVREDGQVLPQPLVGDNSANQGIRAFLAFDLADLAGAKIVDAQLQLNDYVLTGNPLGELGSLHVEEVEIGASLDAEDYEADVVSGLATSTGGAGLGSPIGVRDRVASHVEDDVYAFVVRLRFDMATNGNGTDDHADWSAARLVIRYFR